ncbi:hypothetical protein ACR3K2_31740 [Cryptosporidium serpentis]
MSSYVYEVDVGDISELIIKKLTLNPKYLPKIELVKCLASYSIPIRSLLSSSKLNFLDEHFLDTIIVPALPRSLIRDNNLGNIQCRFTYSQKSKIIAPLTHYDLAIRKFGNTDHGINIYADRLCLRRLVDVIFSKPGLEYPEICINATIRASEGGVIYSEPIRLFPVNMQPGFPSVGFQFETFLTRNNIDIGTNAPGPVKVIDSSYLIDIISIGEVKILCRSELDAIKASSITYGVCPYEKRKTQSSFLTCRNWFQKVYKSPIEYIDRRLNVPCRVIYSDNLRSGIIESDSRVELKTISYRNAGKFPWTSTYFQMLLGTTSTLIKGNHTHGSFTKGSIHSYSLNEVRDFSIKEVHENAAIDIPNVNWDKITIGIAFLEASLKYIRDIFIPEIASTIHSVNDIYGQDINISITRGYRKIIFRLLNELDPLPRMLGPTEDWQKYVDM